MIILNFAHPLSEEHRSKIQEITGQSIDRVIGISAQVDVAQSLEPQVIVLVDQVGFSPLEWQTLPVLINPPSLNFIAVTLLAELHGRCGYFPVCLRMRPVKGSIPTHYEVAEIINLQAVRDRARHKRHSET